MTNLEHLQRLKYLHMQNQLLGAQPDIPNEVYHNTECPGISSSKLKLLNDSYRKYYYSLTAERPKPSKAFLLGSVFHDYILLHDKFGQMYTTSDLLKSKSKQSKLDLAALQSLNENKIIIDPELFAQVVEMAASFHSNTAVKAIMKNGQPELSHWWIDEATQILCKFRSDYLLVEQGIIIDLKTTNDCSRDAFSKGIYDYGYHLSAAFYCDGAKAIYGKDFTFAIIAIEKEPPYELALYVLGDQTIDKGRTQYQNALKKYTTWRDTDNKRLLYDSEFTILDLPKWALTKED